MIGRLAIITFGCKLNQAESQIIKEKLSNLGFQIVSEKQRADFFIINACAVTAKAERELRQKISQLRRKYPKSKIIVTGCYLPQQNDKVDFWFKRGISDKLIKSLLHLVRSLKMKEQVKERVKTIAQAGNIRTRIFVKIQDGCDNFCTYCIVPYLRGKPKNRSVRTIIQEIRKREKEGYQEIVLVGTDLKKIKNQKSKIKNLSDLLKKILKETKIPRIRISSLWPTAITSELINLIKKEPRICPHLHLSMQSGSDKILQRMGRNYKSKEVIRLIKKLCKIPNLNLTADFIVGFPGETEKDFQATINFVKKAKFLKVHIFRYSPRPGTVAAKMPNQISENIKRLRSRKLIALCQKISEKIKRKYLGQIFPVLIESKKDNLWLGFTPNYLRIYVKNSKDLANQIVDVKLLKLYKDGIYGNIISGRHTNLHST